MTDTSLISEDRFIIICQRRKHFETLYNTKCDIDAAGNIFSDGNDVIAIVNGFTTPNLDYEIIKPFTFLCKIQRNILEKVLFSNR